MGATVEPAQSRASMPRSPRRIPRRSWLDAATSDDDGFRLGPERFARKLELTLNSSLERRRSVATRPRAPRSAHRTDRRSMPQLPGGGRSAHVAQLGTDRGPMPCAPRWTTIARAACRRRDDRRGGRSTRSTSTVLDGARERTSPTLTSDEMVVEVMPEFRRGVAIAYCDAPGPLESGGETFLAVAPTPECWTRERVDSFYREYNSAMIVNLIVHEAMPGHALQLAHGRRFKDPPRSVRCS